MDRTEDLRVQVQDAYSQGTPLAIQGGNSKAFYGQHPKPALPLLQTGPHEGIVYYEPTELVVTARAGTRVSDINTVLAEQNQQLAFEPPEMNGQATWGGTLASGFSGPARPWSGAARDHVLGVRILNGRGQVLRFGGEVMKNVAGYDVSRLMVGSMGTLGVILEASVKVLPKPQTQVTVTLAMNREQGLEFMARLGSQPLPINGAVLFESRLYLRLCGSEAGVREAMGQVGGDVFPRGENFWQGLREFTHPFFQTDLSLWRLSLPIRTNLDLPGEVLIDWGGHQWWLRSNALTEAIRSSVSAVGGHATRFRGENRESDVFQRLPAPMATLQERIRLAFDPKGIFNPASVSTKTDAH